MRYSKQRELVMQTVERLCDHPTAEEIYDKAAQECPNLSLGTVYRNLNSLVEAGRVRRVSIPGKADRFDHTLPWHSHLYCTVCGGVTDAKTRRAGCRTAPWCCWACAKSAAAGRMQRPQRQNKHKICVFPLARSGQTGYTKECLL